MSNTRDADAFTLPAHGDLTGKSGCFGKMTGGQVTPCTVLGERAEVIIASEPSVQGDPTDVFPRAGRKVQLKIGAVDIAQDAEITTDANGLGITAVSTNHVRAKALQLSKAGSSVTVLWVDDYIKP